MIIYIIYSRTFHFPSLTPGSPSDPGMFPLLDLLFVQTGVPGVREGNALKCFLTRLEKNKSVRKKQTTAPKNRQNPFCRLRCRIVCFWREPENRKDPCLQRTFHVGCDISSDITNMAEAVGFEPTDRLFTGLPDFESGPL